MSGDRQWTIAGVGHGRPWGIVVDGPDVGDAERIPVVEASRLTAVEAERDALREVVEWAKGMFVPGPGRKTYGDPNVFLDEVKKRTAVVLARFPKQNETEQG